MNRTKRDFSDETQLLSQNAHLPNGSILQKQIGFDELLIKCRKAAENNLPDFLSAHLWGCQNSRTFWKSKEHFGHTSLKTSECLVPVKTRI